ncbi:MAG: succinyldiaminopimelate transaminase [Gammaproteobacteria bacterium]|nr:succinyldiaminopimelate transaminase [Gammaproteobacteria bacterium]MBU1654270.1 succinyldiaminopimelate transaminase [Gammaproteobacteria bacterium]MBU1960647.1 succinyldiaminopimelate transaminase [Gammaproteobacteria bacterium]
MNADLNRLQPYPFEKLAVLFAGSVPPKDLGPIGLSIGEPRHPTPGFITEELLTHLHNLSVYPNTRGLLRLRQAIAQWLICRFKLPEGAVDPETQILPVNGTREALFSFAQAVIDRDGERPLVMMPNPFYQIYEGAALLAGAEPHFIPCRAENGFLPDFDSVGEAEWRRCRLLYLCSPGNPTGAVIGMERLKQLIELADRHSFIIAADECYSEIYFDEGQPPVGLLQAAVEMGNERFKNCVVFHSLSKRSNVPGLRSGFVAGDAEVLGGYFKYRTYHGCAMPLQHQIASCAAWSDEAHVRENRGLYREKFDAVLDRLGGCLKVERPDAGFYLWAETPVGDMEFALGLYRSQNLSVLPGSFLSREADGHNPGAQRIRMALVAPLDECLDAACRIRDYVELR